MSLPYANDSANQVNADDALSSLSKEIESLIQQVQSSSRPSKGIRRRMLDEGDESQAEAGMESEGEIPIEDSSAQAITQTESQTLTVEDIGGCEVEDTAILDRFKAIEGHAQHQHSREEAKAQSEVNAPGENTLEDGSRKTPASDSEAPAVLSEITATTGAEGHVIKDNDIRRLLGTGAQRQADAEDTDTTPRQDSLIAPVSFTEAETSGTVDIEAGTTAINHAPTETQAEEHDTNVSSSIDDTIALANDSEAGIATLADVAADDIVEDVEIKRALVEPDRDYTESPRQMALTSEEDLRLQDVDQAMRSNAYDQSQITEFSKDFNDLAERARLVSRTYERGHKIPSKWELEECQELMHVMGVPVVLAHPPFEAEGLASAMALAGIADFVGTEDSDVLGYEAPLLRNMATTSKPIEIVEGNVLRSAFNLSPEQFIDFLVLLGTDASSRIPGVGPVKAMKLIQQHDTIEGILDRNEKLRALVGPDYLQEVDAAREVFTVLPPLPRPEDLEIPHPDENAVLDFMRQEHGIDMATDLRIPYETQEDIEMAFEAYQSRSSSVVE